MELPCCQRQSGTGVGNEQEVFPSSLNVSELRAIFINQYLFMNDTCNHVVRTRSTIQAANASTSLQYPGTGLQSQRPLRVSPPPWEPGGYLRLIFRAWQKLPTLGSCNWIRQ
jgi:hypothetical protein